MHTFFWAAAMLAAATRIDGTACRVNRHVDHFIVMTDAGARVRVVADESAAITFEGERHQRQDIRPGDRLRVVGEKLANGNVQAQTVDVKLKIADAIFGSLFGKSKDVTGRFSVREAKTEFFSFRMQGGNYIRVDAKSAYGPKGRAWVSTLRSGDLLSMSGDWKSSDLFRASTIQVITDEEPTSCSSRARRGEDKTATREREASEQRFLDGRDDEEEEP